MVQFISVRGHPKEIWSDNDTNFTSAKEELHWSVQDLNKERIKSEFHSQEVEWYSCPLPEWRFQPPAASHRSGVWERLIRSVRKAMKAVLGSPGAPVGLETLRTVFVEVTSILNSCPICPSSDRPNDLELITPNHLLLQRRNLFLESSLKKIFTCANNGDTPSSLLIASSHDGFKNMFQHYSSTQGHSVVFLFRYIQKGGLQASRGSGKIFFRG